MNDLDLAIQNLKDRMIEDYAVNWHRRGDADAEVADHIHDMIAQYKEELHHVEGRKYIKICKGGSVAAFIVAVDNDKKFKKGDILKPASWSTPARNAARGNVFGDYQITWRGAAYL